MYAVNSIQCEYIKNNIHLDVRSSPTDHRQQTRKYQKRIAKSDFTNDDKTFREFCSSGRVDCYSLTVSKECASIRRSNNSRHIARVCVFRRFSALARPKKKGRRKWTTTSRRTNANDIVGKFRSLSCAIHARKQEIRFVFFFSLYQFSWFSFSFVACNSIPNMIAVGNCISFRLTSEKETSKEFPFSSYFYSSSNRSTQKIFVCNERVVIKFVRITNVTFAYICNKYVFHFHALFSPNFEY